MFLMPVGPVTVSFTVLSVLIYQWNPVYFRRKVKASKETAIVCSLAVTVSKTAMRHHTGSNKNRLLRFFVRKEDANNNTVTCPGFRD
jgi:hypothetical protein